MNKRVVELILYGISYMLVLFPFRNVAFDSSPPIPLFCSVLCCKCSEDFCESFCHTKAEHFQDSPNGLYCQVVCWCRDPANQHSGQTVGKTLWVQE